MKIGSTLSDYDRMRVYMKDCDNRVVWKDLKINCDAYSDIFVVISHARSSIGSKVLQGKMAMFKICSVQFNLLQEFQCIGHTTLKFDLNQIDGIDEIDRYPRDFQLSIELEYVQGLLKYND